MHNYIMTMLSGFHCNISKPFKNFISPFNDISGTNNGCVIYSVDINFEYLLGLIKYVCQHGL